MVCLAGNEKTRIIYLISVFFLFNFTESTFLIGQLVTFEQSGLDGRTDKYSSERHQRSGTSPGK